MNEGALGGRSPEISFIEQSGFFSADKQYNPITDGEGKNGEALGNGDYLILVGNKNTTIKMGSAGVLSFAGKGLHHALQPKFDTRSYCDKAIQSADVKSVLYGKGIKNKNGFQIPQPSVVKNPNFKEK